MLFFLEKHSEKKKEKESFGNNLIQKVEKFDFLKNEKDKLKDFIKNFGKNLSSRERIEEIYDQFAHFLPVLSSKIETRNKFIRKIVDIRNDLVHGNVHPEDLDKDNGLFWQCKNLQLMLQLCILSKIGFNNQQIKKIYLLDKITKTQ
jgi:hypothetical protein